MAQMTRMQQKIYDYIAQMLVQEGYPPSVREIGAAVGLKSPSTVHFHLKHMASSKRRDARAAPSRWCSRRCSRRLPRRRCWRRNRR